jgi:DNA-binding MarR family transcriptional regulator
MRRAEEIDLLFRTMMARFFSIPARHPASGPVTFAQMRVLWILEMRGAVTLGTMAEALGVSRPTVTELADRLVAGRYVRRTPSREDRRQAILDLLPGGRRILAEHARRRQERFQKLQKILGREDLEGMARALETLNAILAKWNGGHA